jgi:anthranilate/para-aminobenzoate synthase component I
VTLTALDGHASFALLGPGFGGPGWHLLDELRPCEAGDARLAFVPFEAPGDRPALFRPVAARPVQADFDAPAWERMPGLDPAGYVAAVEEIRSSIRAGDVYQVNLTVRADLPGATGPSLLAALCRRGVPRYAAWVRLPDGTEFVSGSPERLFATEGGRVVAEPMKGTAPAGGEAWLEGSAKDRAELAMITDLVRNDLSPACRPGSVAVPCARRFVALPYAVQAVSDVAGDLLPGLRPLDVLAAMHPGGSVTGAPKAAALSAIRRLETSPRRAYCGALGVLDGERSDFALLIRTALRGPDGWSYGVGGGIVHDSDPALEWEEIRVKAGALACGTRRC